MVRSYEEKSVCSLQLEEQAMSYQSSEKHGGIVLLRWRQRRSIHYQAGRNLPFFRRRTQQRLAITHLSVSHLLNPETMGSIAFQKDADIQKVYFVQPRSPSITTCQCRQLLATPLYLAA